MVKTEAIIGWKKLNLGAAITEPGSARAFKTGDWRTQRPILNKEACIRCGRCWIYCPEAAYSHDEEGYFICDLDYCKGCGTCAQECPTSAITMALEEI
ncbi:MAG: pyruvate ferredoxin oxidoreductase [Syntrophobacter sp. DG_60]|nr:MAG: pyruvate ferredoxin oxidoreductase [Syntrophobacter sp. DG_60]